MAVERIRDEVGAKVPIEVEAEDEATAISALEAGADIVMLDNRAPEEFSRLARTLRSRARELGRRITIEASGGITLETVRGYAEAGVDAVSVGGLTHSARGLDLSFELSP